MYTTHKGLEVELRFSEADPNDSKGLHEGWVCHRVEAQVDGNVVGYLKIEYVPSATLAEKVPTVWHHWNYTDLWAQGGEWGKVWLRAHCALGAVPERLQGVVVVALAAEHIPDDDTLHSELASLEQKTRSLADGPFARFEEFKRNHLDRPQVAFIRTLSKDDGGSADDWQRLGIASLLYQEGAKWLAREKGLPLWSSTIQVPLRRGGTHCFPALAAWEAMATSGKFPITKRPVPWNSEKLVYTLDYTNLGGSA